MMKGEQDRGQWDAELLGYFLNMMSPLVEKGYKADA
jgi:hypothetical protein